MLRGPVPIMRFQYRWLKDLLVKRPHAHHAIPVSVVEGPVVTKTPPEPQAWLHSGAPNVTLAALSNSQISSVLLG